LDPRFAGSDPADIDGYLRSIKILSTTFFGGEARALVLSVIFYRMFKYLYEYESDTSWAKFSGHFLAKFLLLSY
jgi:hypothetical protein